MSRQTITQEQAALILRRLSEDPVWDPATSEELLAMADRGDGSAIDLLVGNLEAALASLPPEQHLPVLDKLDRILDRAGVHAYGRAAEAADLRSELAGLRELDATLTAAASTRVAAAAVSAARAATAELDVRHRVAKAAPAAAASAPAPLVEERVLEAVVKGGKKKSAVPLFSRIVVDFLAEKTRVVPGHRQYGRDTVRQTEATAHLWTALAGDRRVDDYGGDDANTFRNLMLRLPASHGKSGTRAAVRKAVPPLEAIRQADERQKAIDGRNALLPPGAPREPDVGRLAMKTLKRHFSTLSQVWVFAGMLGYVPRDKNIFRGWTYQGVKRGGKKMRGPFSAADLNLLLGSDWMTAAVGEDRWWAVLVAMFAGLRVEEIYRLRPAHDIQTIRGIPCFVIQEHPAPERWSAKSEAGARVVPIHSVLLGLGFEALVERRRAAGAQRLFAARLRPSSDKLSAKFVSDFSRNKTALGMTSMTTFHSFRHNLSTILRNTPQGEIRESWIDAVLGHEGGEDEDGRKRPRSEGVTTYLDTIGVENLRTTVEAVVYPGVDLGLLRPPAS